MESSTDARTTDRLIAVAAVCGFLGVALGAFGAHGLRAMLASVENGAERLAWWETGARYHLTHALAIGLAAFVHERRPSRLAYASAAAFVIGIVVFAGTLYAMALGAPRWLGAITPIGGVSLLAAWAMLGIAALRR
jgi:uncharacterized membrane protein YgdD (TMEM256/DUF423 family)